jgi:hypothetical protein
MRFFLLRRDGGSRRVFKPFAWLGVGSVKLALPRPAHQPSSGFYAIPLRGITQTVRLIDLLLLGLE